MKFIRYCLQFFFTVLTTFKSNRFHPLVWITGEPTIGKNVHIGAFSEVSCSGANLSIGDNCDIALT
jgi:UDP-3-O-[3-hydroxymyristoyl] glucosamine N-acyltransferase